MYDSFIFLIAVIRNQSKSRMAKIPRPFTVVVEGNIGSGKTTFLNHFERLPGIMSLSEPVNLWRNIKGHNLFVCISHIIIYIMYVA